MRDGGRGMRETRDKGRGNKSALLKIENCDIWGIGKRKMDNGNQEMDN